MKTPAGCLLVVYVALIGLSVWLAPSVQAEDASLTTVQHLRGIVIWMSNRDGDWEIFRMNPDGSDKRPLTQNAVSDTNARISPDGRLIAWTQNTQGRNHVWIMNADGSEQRQLVAESTMGEWRDNDHLIVFRGRNDVETYLVDKRSGAETKLWPPQAQLKPREVRGAKPSPDGKLFVGWSPNPRGTWIFSADGSFQKHVHGGCEGQFAPDGSFAYWVMTAGTFGKASLQGEPQEPLYKIHETEYGHTYFPRLSADMRLLAFSACPNNQHDHNNSDYEIFLMGMEGQKPAWDAPVRLTFDSGTDRWPDIFVYRDTTPPTLPRQLQAKTQGQSIRLTWQPAQDAESEIASYQIYRDGVSLAEVTGTTFVDRATAPKRKYIYQVSALNVAGLESDRSEPRKAKTKDAPPSVPSELQAVAGNDLVRLSWAPNPELDIAEYRIYRADSPDADFRRFPSVSAPHYIDEFVENGHTYVYRVTAVDRKYREGSPSSPVSTSPQNRISRGLFALYTFAAGTGDWIYDVSGIEPPLDLQIQDPGKIRWVQGFNGVEFVGSSLIRSPGNAGKLLQQLQKTKQMTLEAWIEPANLKQSGPARIVSMSADSRQRNVTLGQMEADLAYRLRTSRTSTNGIPELDTSQRVLKHEPVHLVATFDGKVKHLYINGQRHSKSQTPGGDFGNWEPFPLVLGNEATGDRTWLGKIFLVAFYDRALLPDEIVQNYQAGHITASTGGLAVLEIADSQ